MVILYRDVRAESRGRWKIEGVMLKFYSGSERCWKIMKENSMSGVMKHRE